MVSGSNQGFPTTIVDIQVMGDRIFVCDLQESVFVLRYKPTAPFHPLLVFAEDTGPKWVTSLTILDYDTLAFSDKFGNVNVVRTCAYEYSICCTVGQFSSLQFSQPIDTICSDQY